MTTEGLPLHPVTGDYADFTDAELEGLRKSLRAQGLIVPIVTWKGEIVDGRHRERLCREMNVRRHYDDISDICASEEEMRKLVAGLNQNRRTRTAPLSNKEKQMRIAEERKRNPNRSAREIAKAAGVHHSTVLQVADSAKSAMVKGKLHRAAKEEEKRARIEAALRADPSRSTNAIANELGVHAATIKRIREAIETNKPLEDMRRVTMPEGAILSDLCAKGIALEDRGISPTDAAKRIGISLSAYTAGRDVFLLANNRRIRGRDMERAKAALAKMDETARPALAYEEVAELILKMWGGHTHVPHNAKRQERVVEDYMHAVIVFAEGASRIGALDVPFLSEDESDRARTELKRARMAINDAIEHLNGGV